MSAPWIAAGPPPGWRGARNVVYRTKANLYVNLTHRCVSACAFCRRLEAPVVSGFDLYLPPDREPSADEAVAAVEAALAERPADEVVFCGYGEPTIRWEVLLDVARRLRGLRPAPRLRLNTNGLGNLINRRDITSEAAGVLDSVSVSLNTHDPVLYARLSPNAFGAAAHAAVCDFIARCVSVKISTVATAVGYPGIDMERTRILASRLGVELEIRPHDDVVHNFPQVT